MFDAILDNIAEIIFELVKLLPPSPFTFTETIQNDTWVLVLQYLDYFINVTAIITVTELWAGFVTMYYFISVPLKYVKVIGS